MAAKQESKVKQEVVKQEIKEGYGQYEMFLKKLVIEGPKEMKKLTMENQELKDEVAELTARLAAYEVKRGAGPVAVDSETIAAQRGQVFDFVDSASDLLRDCERVQRGAPTNCLAVQSQNLKELIKQLLACITEPVFRLPVEALKKELALDWSHWTDQVVNRGKTQTEINYSASVFKLARLSYLVGAIDGACTTPHMK